MPFSLQASAGCEEVAAHPLEATLLDSGNRRHGLPTEHAEHGRPLAFGADFFPSTYGRLPGERLQHGDHQTNPARPALLSDVRPYLPENLARASASQAGRTTGCSQVARARPQGDRKPHRVGALVHTADVDGALDEQLAVTASRAARIAGVSPRRLAAWADRGLVTPEMQHRFSARAQVRLYSLRELTELRVIRMLSDVVSMIAIRKIVDYLRGVDTQVSEVRFATCEGEVYFQFPDGTWSGSRRPGQLVLDHIIPLRNIRETVAAAVRERDRQVGRIVRERKVRQSRPVLDGTRVPVAAVERWLDSGATDARILAAYPDLEVADIDAVRDTRTTAAS